jgi:hypothetical protein
MSQAPLDRRTFACRLAASAVAAPLGASVIEGTASAEPPVEVKKPQLPDKQPPQDQPPSPAQWILELVKQQYPQRLEAEHLQRIAKDIETNLARSKTLSSYPLTNADEPAPVFGAYRSQ